MDEASPPPSPDPEPATADLGRPPRPLGSASGPQSQPEARLFTVGGRPAELRPAGPHCPDSLDRGGRVHRVRPVRAVGQTLRHRVLADRVRVLRVLAAGGVEEDAGPLTVTRA